MSGDETIGGEETLGLSRGLEPLQVSLPLPLPGGLVGVLRSIIERPVLAMFHSRQELALGGTVTLQLIGDDHTRDVGQPFEPLAENLLGRPRFPPALDQDIQDVPVLITRPPEIVMLALDRQKHLIGCHVSPGRGRRRRS